jgi:hypothetical protein
MLRNTKLDFTNVQQSFVCIRCKTDAVKRYSDHRKQNFPLCDVKELMKRHKQAKELRFSQVSNFNSKLEVLEKRTYSIQVSNHDFFCSLPLPLRRSVQQNTGGIRAKFRKCNGSVNKLFFTLFTSAARSDTAFTGPESLMKSSLFQVYCHLFRSLTF